MKKAVSRVVSRLVAEGIVAEEDIPIYHHGLHQIWVTAGNILVAALVSIALGLWLEMLLFLVAYIPIRRHAGGFHAKTEARCAILSVFTEIAAVLLIRHIPSLWAALALMLSSVVILILAPVESSSKPLDALERVVYRRRALCILTAHWIIAATGSTLRLAILLRVIGVADILMAVMLIMGVCKNRLGLQRAAPNSSI